MATKQTKKTTSKKAKSTKLPSSWTLLKSTWLEYSNFWRTLVGISAIYAILYFILVMGLSFTSSIQEISIDGSSKFNEAINTMFSVFGSNALSGNSGSDATVLVQFLLFIIASMAIIWSLRKLQALKKIKLRDAFYFGTYAFIPTIIVSIILIATLLPLVGGSSLLATALQNSGTNTEITIITIISGLLLLFSCYLFTMFWPAFYIVSLPNTKPFQALRSAMKVTKKRRFAIIRKSFVMFLLSITFIFVILLPVALAIPSIIPIVSFLIIFFIFGVYHTYLYNLYRSLL